MRNFIFYSPLLILSLNASANDDLMKVLDLTEEVRTIVLEAPGGNPMPEQKFNLTTEQSDLMMALASLDANFVDHLKAVPDRCEKDEEYEKKKAALLSKVSKRNLVISAAVVASSAKYEQEALGRFMTDEYINYMGQLAQQGIKNSIDIGSLENLITHYSLANPLINIEKVDLKRREEKLNAFAEEYLNVKLPKGLLMKELAFRELILQPDDWKKTLAAANNMLSSGQKVALVSKLGSSFSANYNYARSADSDLAKGKFVSLTSLLDSVRNGTPGGVCRDITLAQTQMLKELGFKNNYVVSFKDISGRHATVISVDPATNKIVKFNYGETTTVTNGTGTNALTQDTSMPEHGLGFKIFDSNGKPVTKVPTEVAQMLKSASNGDTHRDFNQKSYSLARVGFKTDLIEGNLFAGKTSSGETISGIAISNDAKLSDNIKFGYGVAISKFEGNRSLIKIDQENLYARINVELTSPSVKVGPTENRAFAIYNSEALLSNNKQTTLDSGQIKEAKKQLDGDMEVALGLENKYTSASGKTAIDSKIYATMYPDLNHSATAEKIVPVLKDVVLQTNIAHNITKDDKAVIDAAIILRSYGTSMLVKAAVENEKQGTRMITGIAAPISKDMPSFLPGGEKRIFVGLDKAKGNILFSIELERNLKSKANRISVRGEGKF
jgi:hypothetical protein